MIEEYLQKLHQELIEEKLNLEQEKQRNEIQLNNNMKFVRVLEETIDDDFESFSPRKIDEESHKKIVSLMEEQKIIKNDISGLNLKINDIIAKIEELEMILQKIREEQRYIDVPSKHNEKNFQIDSSQQKENDFLISELMRLIHKIENCSKFLDVDIVRCKLEFREIEENAKKLLNNLQQE